MYVGARIFGVGLYVALLCFFCILIGKTKQKNIKGIMIAYAIMLSLMGFFFVPNQQADLYRLRELMNFYAQKPFSVLLSDYVAVSNTPVTLVYYWIIGRTGIDGLLPFVTALIFYLNVFYIFYDYSYKQKITGKALSFTLLIIMCNSSFLEVISGIRTMLSFSIVLRCMYNELYNNRSIIGHLLLYLIAAFIHPVSLVMVLLRFLFILFQKDESRKRKALLVALSIVTIVLLISFGENYVLGAFQKGVGYVSGDPYSYIWEAIISTLILLLLIVIHKNCGKFEYAEGSEKVSLLNNRSFSRMIELIMIVFCFEYNTFYRFGLFNIFLNIPVLLYYTDKVLIKKKNHMKLLYLFCLGILIIVCLRGNLCALKFWSSSL